MRPGPAVKAKAHPKWREAWGCVARRPLCLRWAGQPWLRWSVAACSKLLRNGVPGGSMPWGQRKRCEKGEKEKRSGNEKGPEPLVAGPLLERSGGRTLWGLLPCVATSARWWSGILETIAQPLRLVAIALQIRTECHALLRRQSFGQGGHGRPMHMEQRRPAHGHGALAAAAEDGGAGGVHGGLSAKSGSVVC